MGRKGGRQKLKEKREGKQKKWGKCPLPRVERFLLSHKLGKNKKLFKAPQCSDGIYIAMRKPKKNASTTKFSRRNK